MRRFILVGLLACAGLGGCQRASEGLAAGGGHGRYVGVGHYAPGQMWSQIAGAQAPKDAAAARPEDDEQVIIVMDSTTGEVRQCGNLSGRCIALRPWSEGAAAAPVALRKHAADLNEAPAAAAAAAPVR